ncbi:MAG: glutathione S-transferase C-terminal domain-containing protein [Tatlockia sp.]|jgi:glutathione S-transferase
MITLYQFPGLWGLPNASPFCMKVETYLRMAELPYEIKLVRDPRIAPKGKLPFIQIEEKKIADSEIIIDFLKAKYGDLLDKNLSKEQKAFSVFLDNTLSSYFYWIVVYSRWQYEPNWLHIKADYFAKMPFLLKTFVPRIARKNTLKALYMQGTGRHSYDEVLEMGFKTINALADSLANKKYFHGNEPSTIDGTVFSFLASLAWTPYDDAFKTQLHRQSNLLGFCDRMWSAFYPEFAKPFALNYNEIKTV